MMTVIHWRAGSVEGSADL
jgi:hypothetical protein